MSDYLIFVNEEDAKTRSREAWEAVLGRKKHPEDITEFLWGVIKNPNDDTAILVVSGDTTKLTAAEESSLKSLEDVKAGGFLPEPPMMENPDV